jgi:hypothetical protein
MHYKFPEIRHLDQIRPAIEGRNEFIIAERDWGYVVNYMVSMADTFPDVVTEYDAIRREWVDQTDRGTTTIQMSLVVIASWSKVSAQVAFGYNVAMGQRYTALYQITLIPIS